MDQNSEDEYYLLEESHDVYPEINMFEGTHHDHDLFAHDDKRSVVESKLVKLDLDLHRI